jgi:superfamily II DNA or RNA helicase
MSLSKIDLQPEYRSDLDDLVRDFLEPCLRQSITYRRAVGYFTSSGLSSAARGLKPFVDAGGTMQLIASPLLDAKDFEAIERGEQARDDAIEMALLREISKELEGKDLDRFSMLSWLIAEDMLEIKLAIPMTASDKYRSGIYHEKIGIFSDGEGHSVAFTGSPNETQGGLVTNFESIDVFWSWDDPHGRVKRKIDNFDRLWTNHTAGLKVLDLPEAVHRRLLELRDEEDRKRRANISVADKPYRFSDGLWKHQDEAVESFLEHKRGVLEMATGTGKTRASLAIAEKLLDKKSIGTLVIAADGRDLLDQWAIDVLTLGQSQSPPLLIYKHYDKHKEIDDFLMGPENSILLVSRHFLPRALRRLGSQQAAQTMLIHDEVHALGSPSNRENLDGLSDTITYRLGLSATPEREYDEDGNDFIEEHVGPIIYRYELANAIEDKILAPFNYYPLDYWPTDEDGERISNVYKKVAARKKDGNPMSKAEIWTDLARVYKTSRAKLPVFADFLQQQPEVLDRCIIFVETIEYGAEVLKTVHRYKPGFHTYFGGEDKSVLERFARGYLECLLTCHRLSEGIDIRSLKNVILFSSARARLETIQRIGRCLRIDPLDPQKRAGIVDFVRADQGGGQDNDEHIPTDQLRKEWLTELSKIRPKA